MTANFQSNHLLLWAKTGRGDRAGEYHPLLCHLIDVGIVAGSLWQTVVPFAARSTFASMLEVTPEDAHAWVAFLAATHDVGKAIPSFQAKNVDARRRISSAGFVCEPDAAAPAHATASARVLPEYLSTILGFDVDLAERVAKVVGGHHGVFPTSREIQNVSSAQLGRRHWEILRRSVLEDLARLLGGLPDPPRGQLDNASAMVLAGLVSVADWIGSNERFFPYQSKSPKEVPSVDLIEYTSEAQSLARVALDRLGWNAWPDPGSPRKFAKLFPKVAAPNDLQRVAEEVAFKLKGPGLVILEAPMGEGKTEAAMQIADAAMTRLGQKGCYFALPTQASSNQMFTRMRDFLNERYPSQIVNLQLLHGRAHLSADFSQLRDKDTEDVFALNGVDGAVGQDGASATVIAAEWFTHRKRGLLAPFGVGTVDQALLAVLQTRHSFVRLFGLSQKTVIIDEVHAYDAYMSTLLQGLVRWLASLGTTVVLLSATLPKSPRLGLVAAYARGSNSDPTEALRDARYPRVTWVATGNAGVTAVRASDLATKSISLVKIGPSDGAGQDQDLAVRLHRALANGGCAVVICNTVKRAQTVYLALKELFDTRRDGATPELDLLHAHYTFSEREKRETRVLEKFGKPLGTGQEEANKALRRPARAILVATQIIEQSLDLDFDLMVSDLAPIDLLLQRSGRLWRHQRDKRGGFRAPTLWIRIPTVNAEGLPKFDSGTAAIYDSHVLLRSWLALAGRDAISLPADIELLIEDVYSTDQACPDVGGSPLVRLWEQTRDYQDATLKRHEAIARNNQVPPPDHVDDILDAFSRQLEEDDPDLHISLQALTRLTEPSISAVILSAAEAHGLNSEETPGLDQIRQLLRNSTTLSGHRIVKAALDLPVPSGWVKSPFLRRHRLVILGDDGRGTLGPYRLTVDEELGVCVEETGS